MLKLTPHQTKIAQLVAQGCSNRDIAAQMHTSEQAIKSALHLIFNKIGVWNRVELASRFPLSASPNELKSAHDRIEAQRLAELESCQILDTEAEQVFDEIAQLAITIFKTPISLVGFIDSQRVWFKSSIGLPVSEVRRDLSICQHTIRQSEIFALEDAPRDPRFACNALVKQFGVRSYVAAPVLTVDGYALGVVCVVDQVPRRFTETQLSILTSLARVVSEHLEVRRKVSEARPAVSQFEPEASMSIAAKSA